MSRTSPIELPESARRFHELYRSDLTAVEPASDTQILAAIDRAEAHDRNQIPDAGRWDIAAHLGFVHKRGRCADRRLPVRTTVAPRHNRLLQAHS